MSKKILIIAVSVLVAAFCFAACRSENKTTTQNQNASVTVYDKRGNEVTEKTTKGETAASEKAKKKSDKQNTTAAKKDSWKKNDNGSYSNDKVTVDVSKYSGTSLNDGEELIKSLIKGGLSESEIIANNTSDKSVIYVVSGKKKGSDKTQFFKLEYVQDSSTGYLITYTADNRSDLDGDFSYVTKNYKKLAK